MSYKDLINKVNKTRKNQDLIDKMSRFNTSNKESAILRYVAKAREDGKKEHDEYIKALKFELGHDNFEVSDHSCRALGISNCVHVWRGFKPMRGIGRMVCIYCESDDFTF